MKASGKVEEYPILCQLTSNLFHQLSKFLFKKADIFSKNLSIFHSNDENSITDAILLSGQSDRMVLQAYTQKSDQLFETNESALTNMDGFQLTPVFGVLMTVGCSMAIVFLSISGKNVHKFL